MAKSFLSAALALVLILSIAALKRNLLWKDGFSIWLAAAEKSPLKIRPHNNLGLAYDAMGMKDSAIAEYERALAMDSTYAAAKKNLVALYTDEAFIYGKRGDYSSSIAIFKKALSIEVENAAVLYGLALAHESIRDYDEAFRYWEMFVANAAQDDPFVETAQGRINALRKQGTKTDYRPKDDY